MPSECVLFLVTHYLFVRHSSVCRKKQQNTRLFLYAEQVFDLFLDYGNHYKQVISPTKVLAVRFSRSNLNKMESISLKVRAPVPANIHEQVNRLPAGTNLRFGDFYGFSHKNHEF